MIKHLQQLQIWQLVVLLLLAGFVAATFLRLDNIGMIQRRDAVLAADKTGDHEAMLDRLAELQRYSLTHMNANTGTFYLEEQYKRDVQKIVDTASNDNNPYGNINAKVDQLCRSRFSSYSQAWVQCFAQELAKYPPAPNPSDKADLPSTDLYRYAFLSPVWTPDFAGWSVVVCLVIALVIVVSLASMGILRLLLKIQYRGI